jgi:nucleoside-diphosphate-sugar epimerase
MLIGRGLIAKSFADMANRTDVTIFASGVANSLETRESEFERERQLLLAECEKNKGLFVYFGTASVHDKAEQARAYVRHKLAMEELVISRCAAFNIFRLPQVVGRSANGATLIEYFRAQILSGESFQVWSNARRRLIDIDDVGRICRHVIASGSVHSSVIDLVPSVSITAPEIVRELEAILGLAANCTFVPRGGDLEVETSKMEDLMRQVGLKFDADYPRALIRKYYSV